LQRIIFLILPDVEILDLAGPLQVFHEANRYGASYNFLLCAPTSVVRADQGVSLADLQPLVDVVEGDLVVVPGIRTTSLDKVSRDVLKWLREAHARRAQICSICTGAFVLAQAGLLDGRQCTTHWTRTEELQRQFPRVKVITNRLFVEDERLTTSAGIAAGIDLALSIVERRHGPRLTAAVAREMVVYLRRDGSQKQDSVYLDYRAHLHPGVHRVQDLLSSQPEERRTLRQLSVLANMSERNLTRVFRQATGIAIGDYVTRLRLELARTLLADPQLSLEAIAARCGFESARQLRRISKRIFGASLASFRKPS
jgi:transcriptional regulator GlxA family with amidase domain